MKKVNLVFMALLASSNLSFSVTSPSGNEKIHAVIGAAAVTAAAVFVVYVYKRCTRKPAVNLRDSMLVDDNASGEVAE